MQKIVKQAVAVLLAVSLSTAGAYRIGGGYVPTTPDTTTTVAAQ